MERPPPDSAGNTPSPSTGPGPPRSRSYLAGGQTHAQASLEREFPPPPLRPTDSRQPAESRPTTSVPTIGRSLQPNPTTINRGHGRPAFTVQSFSCTAGYMLELCAVIDDGIEYSVVHPFAVQALGLRSWIFPLGHPLLGQHRMSAMGRYTIRRYTGLVINQRSLGIEAEGMLLMVLDDCFPYSGVDVCLGRQFINRFLGGQLPRLLSPQIPTSENISQQDFFAQGR
ncbi:hypothetical protein B0T18DRAFT_182834 [Schizothecium vesticola]|uniref:Uncharacterized protein n=1 Tax=Schizothecium vesticola TaxID=314040 RepID=A0AA40EQ37_9PEZI|nr:hypothetical protein B0T18DRAFT_182834 [Schizothecium vesticola]